MKYSPTIRSLPPVQTIVMRILLRSWRTRYSLKVSQVRFKTQRTVTWASFYQLKLKGFVYFNAMSASWSVPCWHGKPIVRVTADGKVSPVKGRFSEYHEQQERVHNALRRGQRVA